MAAAGLGLYGLYVQASTGDGASSGLLSLWPPWQAQAGPTATPTKTPAAGVTPTTTPTALQELPTLTPTPTSPPSEKPEPSEPGVEVVQPTATSTPRPPLAEDLLSVARDQGVDPSGDFVVIDQNQQRMHVVEAGFEARTLPVSTGDPDNHFHTPAWTGTVGEYWGSFNARGVWGDNAWYLFTLDGGGTILIHSAPYVMEDGVKVYQELDAVGLYPASRGCIRLLPEDAQWFSDWQPQGVPVVILAWDGGTSRQG
jgi:lipoprotein-anchoring transpeptidase ErfK/SrfK